MKELLKNMLCLGLILGTVACCTDLRLHLPYLANITVPGTGATAGGALSTVPRCAIDIYQSTQTPVPLSSPTGNAIDPSPINPVTAPATGIAFNSTTGLSGATTLTTPATISDYTTDSVPPPNTAAAHPPVAAHSALFATAAPACPISAYTIPAFNFANQPYLYRNPSYTFAATTFAAGHAAPATATTYNIDPARIIPDPQLTSINQ